MRSSAQNTSFVYGVIQKLRCQKKISTSIDEQNIFKVWHWTQLPFSDASTSKPTEVIVDSKSSAKGKWTYERWRPVAEKKYVDKKLFGKLIKKKEEKRKSKGQKKLEKKAESKEVDDADKSELAWVLKMSNAKHITYLSTAKQKKQVKEEFNDHKNTECEANAKNDKNVIKTDNVPEYVAEDVSQSVSNNSPTVQQEKVENVTSFPIFGFGTVENKASSKEVHKSADIPSVTRILQDTMSASSKKALEYWRRKMIEELGVEQFNIYYKELLSKGKLLHSCIEDTLLQKEVNVPSEVELAYSSMKSVLCDVRAVERLESYVEHPNLRYKGVLDCIASYRGDLYLIDWKKSTSRKATLASTYDAPLQLAAYIGAVNASEEYPFKSLSFSTFGKLQEIEYLFHKCRKVVPRRGHLWRKYWNAKSQGIDRGLIVIAYMDGEPAAVHEVKEQVLNESWSNWLKRLQQFYAMNKKEEKVP